MEKTFIIAEMACSHEGDPELARGIIDSAARAGADAVQFQIWSLKDMVVPHHPEYEKLKGIELTRGQWQELAAYTRDRYPEMSIIACVSEGASTDFAEKMGADGYKVHSGDLSNTRLLKCVAEKRKRIDLSIGASTLDEIHDAIERIRVISGSEICLMYGYQNFPTPTDAIHLSYMMKLRNLFELPIGYQDHSDAETDAAFYLPAAAAGMGVDVLEKHITHDRSLKGADHEAALNPDEFARFVSMVREIDSAKGDSRPKPFSEQESKYRKYSKKSIVAKRDIPKDSPLEESDLLFMRAHRTGLPPDQSHRLITRKTKHELSAFQLIMEGDVA